MNATDFVASNFGNQNLGMGARSERIVYNTFNGFLYYNENGSTAGSGANGGFFATVLSGGSPVASLTAADFIVA